MPVWTRSALVLVPERIEETDPNVIKQIYTYDIFYVVVHPLIAEVKILKSQNEKAPHSLEREYLNPEHLREIDN